MRVNVGDAVVAADCAGAWPLAMLGAGMLGELDGPAMTSKVKASDSAELCAIALAICGAWLDLYLPDTTIRVEIAEGEWHLMHLPTAIELALEAFLDEHGDES